MKKKLALILALMLSLVALFSLTVIGVVAEEAPTSKWTVEANDITTVEGGNGTVIFTLKYDGKVVDSIINASDDSVEYTAKPYFEVFEGETKVEVDANGIITSEKMEAGERTYTIKVYDKKDGKLLGQDDFTFNITKKDNTMTIVMIVGIVLLIGYMIWSNISQKKKAKEAQSQVSALKIGDRVKTIGGVCGFVSEINDAENTFTLEVGKDSFVKFDKGAIYQTGPAQGTAKEEAPAEKTEEKVEVAEENKEEKK